MLPLRTKTFPTSATELERLLNESLREVVVAGSEAVRVADEKYPALKEITIDLNGAKARSDFHKPPPLKGDPSGALTVKKFSLRGDGISIGPAAVSLTLEASNVALNRRTDARDEIVLFVDGVANGRMEISTTKREMENAVAEVAKIQAAKHGVAIEEVRMTLRQLGPRAVEIEINLRARKMFFAASVQISGKGEIDDEMNAAISDLRCNGDGAIGSLACGFLAPHLQKLDGRSFPLMSLSLGEIQLREVRLETREAIRISAEFAT